MKRLYCSLPETPARILPLHVAGDRLRAINLYGNKWVSGTVLHYYFFDRDTDFTDVRLPDGTIERRSWVGDETQKAVVRKAFLNWRDVGLGVKFEEVASRQAAEVRIGFMQG